MPSVTSERSNYSFENLLEAGGYCIRPIQLKMMHAVAEALEMKHHLVVEAGTGAGKSFGYLIPALMKKRQGPLVISTGSIALQEQLLVKDVPAIAKLLFDDEEALNAKLVKGRSNYLCIHKMDELEAQLGEGRSSESIEKKQMRLQIQQLRSALLENWDGDKATLDFEVPFGFWHHVASETEECLGWRCRFWDQNPYKHAREELEKADILITNHALYCQDLLSSGGILPPHELVIFDEAHSLKDYATNAFSASIGRYRSQQLLAKISKHIMPIPEEALWELRDVEAHIMHWLFQQVRQRQGEKHRIRLYEEESLVQKSQEVVNVLNTVVQWFSSLDVNNLPHSSLDEKKQNAFEIQFSKLFEQLKELCTAWGYFAGSAVSECRVNWAELEEDKMNFQLISTPLNVQEELEERLWKHRTAILTSATLAVNKKLKHALNNLGFKEPAFQGNTESPYQYKELLLPSAFNSQSNSLCYIPHPNEIPEFPTHPDYWEAFIAHMASLLEASQGRAFVLFTSYHAMHKVATALSMRVQYPIRMQGDFPRHRLIEWFKEAKNPVLLGTYTFWEGIDIPGQQLSMVIIDRLPFTAPDEPIHEATVEAMKKNGQDWFKEYALHSAVLKLKQGVGRLLRHEEDRGVVALLDSRLRSKHYGQSILASLPPMPCSSSIIEVSNFLETIPSRTLQGPLNTLFDGVRDLKNTL